MQSLRAVAAGSLRAKLAPHDGCEETELHLYLRLHLAAWSIYTCWAGESCWGCHTAVIR